MHRHSTVALVLFLAAGCEHSGSLDTPSTPTASTEPSEAPPPPPGEPTAEPTAAPGASANPNAVVPPELLRPNADYVGGARWSPGWGGERPRLKLQDGLLVLKPAPAMPAPEEAAAKTKAGEAK